MPLHLLIKVKAADASVKQIFVRDKKRLCVTPPPGPLHTYDILRGDTNAKTKQPDPCCEILVDNIDPNVSDLALKRLLSLFGIVRNVCMENVNDGESRACAKVTFTSRIDADAIKKHLCGKLLGERRLRIEAVRPTTSVHVSSLHATVTADVLHRIFGIFGPICKCGTYTQGENCGYVCFERRADADAAKQELDGLMLCGRRMQVGYGRTAVRSSSVHFALSSCDRRIASHGPLHRAFSAFGSVKRLCVFETGTSPSANSHPGGFVEYADDALGISMRRAVRCMHGRTIEGAQIKFGCSKGCGYLIRKVGLRGVL